MWVGEGRYSLTDDFLGLRGGSGHTSGHPWGGGGRGARGPLSGVHNFGVPKKIVVLRAENGKKNAPGGIPTEPPGGARPRPPRVTKLKKNRLLPRMANAESQLHLLTSVPWLIHF